MSVHRSHNAVAGAALAAGIASSLSPARARSLPLDLSRVAQRARAAADCTQAELAAAIKTRPQLIAEHENANDPHLPRVDHVALAPVEYRRVIVRELAALDGDSVRESVTVVHGDNHAARLAAVTIECSDVPRTLAVALADGEMSDAELEDFAKQCRECAAAALEGEAFATQELARRRAARSAKR